MSEIWPFGVIAYVLIGMVVGRMIAGHLAWMMFENDKIRYPSLRRDQTHPSGEQWFGAIAGAIVLCTIWPVLWFLCRVKAPKIGAERRAELREREERIRQAERELGL